jgi:hypothetical protein
MPSPKGYVADIRDRVSEGAERPIRGDVGGHDTEGGYSCAGSSPSFCDLSFPLPIAVARYGRRQRAFFRGGGLV